MTQRWWEKDEGAFADLLVGLTQLNRRTNGHVDAELERYARALKSFARGYCNARYGADRTFEEAPQIRKFVRDAAMSYLDEDFMDGEVLRRLVQTLRQVTSDGAMRKVELEEAGETQDPQAARSMGDWLGTLLFIVRSNPDHEETTASGSQAAKAQRDPRVLSAALPVLEELVLRTLEQPQYRLAVYGTLRAGEPNHYRIADLGDAAYGSVFGSVVQRDSYPVLRWQLSGDDVPVEVYASTRLTPEKWAGLNEFEGDGYRRLLIPVRDKTSGERIVATIYADARSYAGAS